MTQFIQAHGNTPGPTQRPWTAGLLAGLLAMIPAAALLWPIGALASLSEALHLPLWLDGALQVVVMGAAGAIYGRLFNRAANDVRGGWLYGVSYGFLVWMLGPVVIIQWSVGRPVVQGYPAMGLFGGYLLWGLVMGLAFPWLHRALQKQLRDGSFGLH